MKKYIYIVLIFTFCIIQNRAFPQNSLNTVINSSESQILELMDKGNIPGAVIVVVKGNEEIIKTYGYRDVRKELPVTSNTLFELGSCSKAFTALSVMDLLQKNKLNLNDYVLDYLPWFKAYYQGNEAKIKISHLLHHTSGIPWETISKIPQANSNDALEKTVRTLVNQELSNSPGSTFEYATINYDILALIVQKVAGQSFESYLQDQIFNKLDLRSTTIGEPIDSVLMSTGYKIGFFHPREYKAPVFKGNNAAGYVISNGEDMAEWLKFQIGISNNDLYSAAKMTHNRDKTVALHGMSSYASGWEVALDGSGEISHAGVNPNFTTQIIFRPADQMGVVVLTNSNSTYTPIIANKVMKTLAGEEAALEFDPGDNNDKIYSIISIILSVYCLVVIFLTVRIVFKVIKGERHYEKVGWRRLGVFIRSVLFIIPFLYGLYILPNAIAGFTWNSILVWTPSSFEVLLWVLLVVIGLSYLSFMLSLIFPEQNKYKRMAPQIILLSILSGLSNVIIIVLVTSAINSDGELKYLIFYYTLALFIYLLGRRFVQVNLIRITRGVVYDLRMTLIGKIFSTSYQKFEKVERGRIYTALNDDINTIGESTNIFMQLLTSVITALGAFLYLSSVAFWATMLTIGLIITLASLYSFVANRTNKYFIEAREERNVFMGLLNGMIDGFKEISLHRNKKLAFKQDVDTSAGAFKEKLTKADIKFVNAFLVGESLLVILLGMVAFGMPEFFQNIKVYTIMSFVIVLLYLIGPINGILGSVPSLMQLKVAWNRVQTFLKDIPANLNLNISPEPINPNVTSIQVKGVTFEYENKNEKHSFGIGPIDFEVKKGEVVFIIGGNGSGKTTLAKLITGLYSAESGVIMINGEEVTNSELSEYFSVVFSPSHLFKKLYNVDTASKTSEIAEYLNLLNLTDKVEILNNEYSTIDLSGGQRKRLALLQCYLEGSPIYLFDEWAADQDPDYRNFFYRTLLPAMKKEGKIVIAITHDDHYFDVADRVLKMENGKVMEYLNEYI